MINTAMAQIVGTPEFYPENEKLLQLHVLFTQVYFFVCIGTTQNNRGEKKGNFVIISHKTPKTGRTKLVSPFQNCW